MRATILKSLAIPRTASLTASRSSVLFTRPYSTPAMEKGMIKCTEEDEKFLRHYLNEMTFAQHIGRSFKPVARDPIPELSPNGMRRCDGWRITYSGEATDDMDNSLGSMHGAACCWTLDNLTSAAVAMLSAPGFWGEPNTGGVSTQLLHNFFHAAPIGSKLKVSVVIDKLGKHHGNATCEIADAESGKVFSRGLHALAWSPGKSKGKLGAKL